MRTITAIELLPENIEKEGETLLFLAGGVGKDWRNKVINHFKGKHNLIIVNPVGQHYNVKRNTKWEVDAITSSDIIAFAFLETSIAPLSLFELGLAIGMKKSIVLFIENNYPKQDYLQEIIKYYDLPATEHFPYFLDLLDFHVDSIIKNKLINGIDYIV